LKASSASNPKPIPEVKTNPEIKLTPIVPEILPESHKNPTDSPLKEIQPEVGSGAKPYEYQPNPFPLNHDLPENHEPEIPQESAPEMKGNASSESKPQTQLERLQAQKLHIVDEIDDLRNYSKILDEGSIE
jgi:hypothetical protein